VPEAAPIVRAFPSTRSPSARLRAVYRRTFWR
jgi:hypothetical protein